MTGPAETPCRFTNAAADHCHTHGGCRVAGTDWCYQAPADLRSAGPAEHPDSDELRELMQPHPSKWAPIRVCDAVLAAADEIDRLRAKVDMLIALVDAERASGAELDWMHSEAAAEVTRLTAELDQLKDQNAHLRRAATEDSL